MYNKINVLFDQRSIPNYRIGFFNKLSRKSKINLTVSYWKYDFVGDTNTHLAGITFNTVEFNPYYIQKRKKKFWLNIDLFKYIYKHRPDIVIGPLGIFGIHIIFSFLVEFFFSLIFGIKFVYRTSGAFLPDKNIKKKTSGFKKIWYRVLFFKKNVLVYTEKASKLILEQGGKNVKVFVDYNSMDSEELFAIRNRLEKTKKLWTDKIILNQSLKYKHYILFVGRILTEKRVDILLDAWLLINMEFKDWGIIIIGSGPEQKILKKKYNNRSVVFIDGIYEHKELAKYYILSDIIVFPGYATLSAHFAMCFGKPIISSEFGNETEYIQDGKNGYKYIYGDKKDLTDKIIKLVNDKELRMQFGETSERMVKEKININHMVDTAYNVILESVK